MQTEAVFENIAERIKLEISKAQKSIYIAVAWFTNKNLFDELVKKAVDGCTIYLIISNDFINNNSGIDFKRLHIDKSKTYKIGNGDTELMHNKFCIIDHSTVITGSYNWSTKAERNFENIIITEGDATLAEQFIIEFNNIRKKYYAEDEKEEIIFPISSIIKRLEILKNLIFLEDIEEIKRLNQKLSEYSFNIEIYEIITSVRLQKFADATNKILKFLTSHSQLSIYSDPEIWALKFEIKNLENQLNSYDNEKVEIEKLLAKFQHRHTLELGEIILRILELNKLKFKSDKSKFEEAESDEKQYRNQVESEKGKKVLNLSEDQLLEMKKTFRKATILCHPDKVSDQFKLAAQEIFIELKHAYDLNDITRVTEILKDLENGNYFKSRLETINEKEILKSIITKLKREVKNLETEIITIKNSNTFNTINEIEDWDYYFNRIKEELKVELEKLKNEL